MPILAGLKGSSLASECWFYTPEHSSKEGPHETEF